MEQVKKSSQECAEYNERNKAAIDVGVMEAQVPDAATLASEKQAADANNEKRMAKALFELVVGREVEMNTGPWHRSFQCNGGTIEESVTIYLKAIKNSYRDTVDYWKLHIDTGYGSGRRVKKWQKLCDTIQFKNTAEADRAKASFKEAMDAAIEHRQSVNASDAAYKKKVAAEKSGRAIYEQNKATFDALLDGPCLSGISETAGIITAKLELKLTLEQWQRVAGIAAWKAE